MVKPRILVVDDEEPIRKTLRMTLEYEGYDVSEGSSGAEALDKIENERYDLVFLDIKMPGWTASKFSESFASAPRRLKSSS